ncbi:CD320 antigen-like [Styela clava]
MIYSKLFLLACFCFFQVLATEEIVMWECHDGQKIEKAYKCDRIRDCWDGSDELREVCNSKCSVEEFACKTKNECVAPENVCDKFDDCTDASDEAFDLCGPVATTEPPKFGLCPESDFECLDGLRCVSKTFVCDNFPNCADGSDESDCENADNYVVVGPSEPPTTKPPVRIPKKCSKRPFLTKCQPFWPTLIVDLNKKLDKKCFKKPNSKRCTK